MPYERKVNNKVTAGTTRMVVLIVVDTNMIIAKLYNNFSILLSNMYMVTYTKYMTPRKYEFSKRATNPSLNYQLVVDNKLFNYIYNLGLVGQNFVHNGTSTKNRINAITLNK